MWSDHFHPPAKMVSESWAVHWDLDNSGVWTAASYEGGYYNVCLGVRCTNNNPDVWTNSVYVFGNSEIAGMLVADADTIPSQLQLLLPAYRVVNEGIAGVGIAGALAKLKTVALKSGDIVIFVDGGTDVNGVYGEASGVWRWPLRYICEAEHVFALVALLCNPTYPPAVDDAAWLRTAVRRMIADYQQTVSQASEYTTAHGGTFFHFLQPALFANPLTPDEQYAISTLEPGQDKVYVVAWPELQAVAPDLTHPLSGLRRSGGAFFDFLHTTERGNEAVARAIFDSISTF